MKSSPIIITATLLIGTALTQAQSLLDAQVSAAPITNANDSFHEFTVTYGPIANVDPASLGDDDLIIGRGSLFDPQLGANAFYPELVSVIEDDGSINATYRIDRPEGGWASWALSYVGISIAANGISDLNGEPVSPQGLGVNLIIDLQDVPQMATRMAAYAVIQGEDDPSVTFDVIYETNFDMDVSALGNGEILALAQRGEFEVHTEEGTVVSLPYFDSPFLAPVVDKAQVSDDGSILTVTYGIGRPANGWGIGDSIVIDLNRSNLGVNNRAQPTRGSSSIGRLLIARDQSLVGFVSGSESVGFSEAMISLEVTYQSSAGAIDLTTLGDDDLGSDQKNYATGQRQAARLGEILSISEDGRVVVAKYLLDRPTEGWLHIGAKTRLIVASLEDGVSTVDGVSLARAEMGRFYFASEANQAEAQIIGLDEWLKIMEQAVGKNDSISMVSDHDHDGLEDVLEFMVGTSPTDPADSSPIKATVIGNGKDSFLQLSYQHRINGSFAELTLEGSTDGRSWLPVEDVFNDNTPQNAVSNGMRSVTLVSAVSIGNLPFHFFRLRAELAQ